MDFCESKTIRGHFRAYKNGDEHIVTGFRELLVTYMSNGRTHWFVTNRGTGPEPIDLGKVFQVTSVETHQPYLCVFDENIAVFLTQSQYGCEVVTIFESGAMFKYIGFVDYRVKDDLIYTVDGVQTTENEFEVRAALTELSLKNRSYILPTRSVIGDLIEAAKPMTAASAAASAAAAAMTAAAAVKTAAAPVVAYAAERAAFAAAQAMRTATTYLQSHPHLT